MLDTNPRLKPSLNFKEWLDFNNSLWAQEPTIFPQALPLGSVSFCLQKALLSCTKARLL